LRLINTLIYFTYLLSPPHGTYTKLKREIKNKDDERDRSPVQSHYHEGSPVGKKSLRWKGFVEKVGLSLK